MQRGCETHNNVALEVYAEEPTCLRWAFSDFHFPFYQNKSYVRPCSAEELRRIQGIPVAELPCFVQLLQLFARDRMFMNRRPNFHPLHHLFADNIEDLAGFLEGWVADYRPWLVVRRLSQVSVDGCPDRFKGWNFKLSAVLSPDSSVEHCQTFI